MSCPIQIVGNPLLAKLDLQNPAFVNELVTAILGISTDAMDEDKKKKTVDECLSIMWNFIGSHAKEKFGFPDDTRILSIQKYPDVGVKFPDVKDKLEQCYQAFLLEIEKSWVEEEPGAEVAKEEDDKLPDFDF
jgi:hypothetical protein